MKLDDIQNGDFYLDTYSTHNHFPLFQLISEFPWPNWHNSYTLTNRAENHDTFFYQKRVPFNDFPPGECNFPGPLPRRGYFAVCCIDECDAKLRTLEWSLERSQVWQKKRKMKGPSRWRKLTHLQRNII